MPQLPLDSVVVDLLKNRVSELEVKLNADCIALYGPIMYGVEQRLIQALNMVPSQNRRKNLAVILDTPGGVVEVVDRMVQAIRYNYQEVYFIVPNHAMSAGTVFAMSGDRIYMNYFSVLGPIDPQIQKDNKLIPALAYLSEYETLVKKSQAKQLTTAEFALLQKLDLGELHTFTQARDLSVELLEKWLSTYKFKDWTVTETLGTQVTSDMRKQRAKEIAVNLMNHGKWHSHSRCITMEMLKQDLNLKIEDYWTDTDLKKKVHDYFDVFADFLTQKGISSFVHSGYYF
jgi:membrane-bound ClpP family serine protease